MAKLLETWVLWTFWEAGKVRSNEIGTIHQSAKKSGSWVLV